MGTQQLELTQRFQQQHSITVVSNRWFSSGLGLENLSEGDSYCQGQRKAVITSNHLDLALTSKVKTGLRGDGAIPSLSTSDSTTATI